jgi:hypothetical protein
MSAFLVEHGAVIAYVLVGVIAFIGLVVIQLIRRRRDVKRARLAVRLASHSISEPRPGPIAVTGTYRTSRTERWLECNGQRVALDSELAVVRGTRAHWKHGARTYVVRDGDQVIAIGVMSRRDAGNDAAVGWRLIASAGEPGIQFFALKPRPAPPPLWPWRAPMFLAVCGAIAYFGLYGIGGLLLDVPKAPDQTQCTERLLRFAVASALPEVRDQALVKYRAELERCPNPTKN